MTEIATEHHRRGGGWQESLRTVVLYVLTGLIGWVGLTLNDQSKAIVKLQVTVETMQEANGALNQQLTALPALSREVDKIQLQVDGHERRLSDLEGRGQQPQLNRWTK